MLWAAYQRDYGVKGGVAYISKSRARAQEFANNLMQTITGAYFTHENNGDIMFYNGIEVWVDEYEGEPVLRVDDRPTFNQMARKAADIRKRIVMMRHGIPE